MTCREKLMIEQPELIDPNFTGGCANCPSTYGYLDDPEFCDYCAIDFEERCVKCWDREIPETEHSDEQKHTENNEEDKEESGFAIEIVYTGYVREILSGVKYFELLNDTRVFKIEHVDSDIYTFIPAEHVIRIGKIWNGKDIH